MKIFFGRLLAWFTGQSWEFNAFVLVIEEECLDGYRVKIRTDMIVDDMNEAVELAFVLINEGFPCVSVYKATALPLCWHNPEVTFFGMERPHEKPCVGLSKPAQKMLVGESW